MRIWCLAAAALLLVGCDDHANQRVSTGTPPSEGGPAHHLLNLHPLGAVFSGDGKLLLVGYAIAEAPYRSYKAPSLALWEVESGKRLWTAEDAENLTPVGFLPDNKTALVRGYNSLQVWDMAEGKRVSNFPQTPNAFMGYVSLSHDGKFALIAESLGPKGGVPTRLTLWDVALRKPIRTLGETYAFISKLIFSPDDHLVLSVAPPSQGEPDEVALWDICIGKKLRGFAKEKYAGPLTGFFPDGRRAFSGCPGKGQERRIAVWDVPTGKELRQLNIPREVNRVFASDDQHLLFFGIRNITSFDCSQVGVVWTRPAEVGVAALSRDGKIAFTGGGGIEFTGVGPKGLVGGNGLMRSVLWDAKEGTVIRELEVIRGPEVIRVFNDQKIGRMSGRP